MEKLSQFLSRKSILTIYKSFVRPNLDYEDIIYDKPLDESFKKKIESVQYNAELIITGAITEICREKFWNLCQTEDGVENLFFSQNNLRFATILRSKQSHSI